MKFAGFFTRFFALLFDNLFMVILAFVVAFFLGGFAAVTGGTNSGILSFLSNTTLVILYVALLLFQFLYFGYFWSKSGQSLGMKMLNIKVIRRGDDENISFLRGALRGSVGYWISGFIFSLGFIWAAFDGNKEAWHDKIFDTWVVKA